MNEKAGGIFHLFLNYVYFVEKQGEQPFPKNLNGREFLAARN